MSRNKHPEETVELILNTAQTLFFEKGYEHTTIQDIVAHLGGLTKGAIYHHFNSKEEILLAVIDRIFQNNTLYSKWTAIQKNTHLTGGEKIKKMLLAAIYDEQEQQCRSLGFNLQNMPQVLSDLLLRSVNEIAPTVYQPIIEEGIKDGSIKLPYAKELAEITAFLANIWFNPLVFSMSKEDMRRKFEVVCMLMQTLGLDISDIYPALEEMLYTDQ